MYEQFQYDANKVMKEIQVSQDVIPVNRPVNIVVPKEPGKLFSC